MRLASKPDIPRLQTVYDEAIAYAESVGHIDWPKPFPASLLQGYIKARELYKFEEGDLLVAALRISRDRDPRIWDDDGSAHVYLGKVATSAAVRSQHYFESAMLPTVLETLEEQDTSIRLDCLADNIPLQTFYARIGFNSQGNVMFYSPSQETDITVTRMELPGPF